MKVATCPDCDTPVVHGYEESTGVTRVLDLREVQGGPYELVGKGLMRRRLTPAGNPANGGKGLRLHAPNCPALIAKAKAASDAATKRTNSHGVAVPQNEIAQPPRPQSPPPAVLIEIQDLLGIEQHWGRKGEEAGTGYHDATGYPLGRATCAVCSQPIIVAAHHHRPDGRAPVLLIDKKHPKGPWRLFLKDGAGPFAEFTNERDPLGTHFNHRVVCPKARPRPKD